MHKIEYRLAVIGSTGNIGRHFLMALSQSEMKPKEVFALSNSANSIQISYGFSDRLNTIQIENFDFTKVDIVVCALHENDAIKYSKKATDCGCIVIDLSSAHRMDEAIPLIIPEVNPEDIVHYKNKNIISSPNCITIPLLVSLNEIHLMNRIKRIILSTYQSVSGAGREAMDDLHLQTKGKFFHVEKKDFNSFEREIAFNCIPKIGNFYEDQYTEEENKISKEICKIWHSDSIKTSATCVRVPTFVGHSISATIEFTEPITPEKIIELNREIDWIVTSEKDNLLEYCTPLECVGESEVFVSRIRKDRALDNGISMWIVCDNQQKGGALNALQILELLIKYEVAQEQILQRREKISKHNTAN